MLTASWPSGLLDLKPPQVRKVYISPDPRKHHGGPDIVIQRKKSSKRNRGLLQSQSYRHGPVLVIVREGRILMPKSYKAIQSPSLSAESPVTAQESSGSEGARIAVPSPPQDFPVVENTAERIQDGPAS